MLRALVAQSCERTEHYRIQYLDAYPDGGGLSSPCCEPRLEGTVTVERVQWTLSNVIHSQSTVSLANNITSWILGATTGASAVRLAFAWCQRRWFRRRIRSRSPTGLAFAWCQRRHRPGVHPV